MHSGFLGPPILPVMELPPGQKTPEKTPGLTWGLPGAQSRHLAGKMSSELRGYH